MGGVGSRAVQGDEALCEFAVAGEQGEPRLVRPRRRLLAVHQHGPEAAAASLLYHAYFLVAGFVWRTRRVGNEPQ